MHGPKRRKGCEKLGPFILKDNMDRDSFDQWHCVLKLLVEVRMELNINLEFKVASDISIDRNEDMVTQFNVDSVRELDLVKSDRVARLFVVIFDAWETVSSGC